jgi:hypothetical protein
MPASGTHASFGREQMKSAMVAPPISTTRSWASPCVGMLDPIFVRESKIAADDGTDNVRH